MTPAPTLIDNPVGEAVLHLVVVYIRPILLDESITEVVENGLRRRFEAFDQRFDVFGLVRAV